MGLIKNQSVNASVTGADGNLSVTGTFQLIQDVITELMGLHKIDNVSVKRDYNAFWVFVKTRVKFFKSLAWNESYTVHAFVSFLSVVKMNVDVELKNAAGEAVFYSRTEMCALDISTQRIRKLSTVGVDGSLLSEGEAVDVQFTKFDETDLPLTGSVQIQSTNIDFSRHTNNAEYVRLIMNTYSVAETEAMQIKEMEVIFAGQSYEGDVLQIKKAAFSDKHLVVLEKNGASVVKCEIVC